MRLAFEFQTRDWPVRKGLQMRWFDEKEFFDSFRWGGRAGLSGIKRAKKKNKKTLHADTAFKNAAEGARQLERLSPFTKGIALSLWRRCFPGLGFGRIPRPCSLAPGLLLGTVPHSKKIPANPTRILWVPSHKAHRSALRSVFPFALSPQEKRWGQKRVTLSAKGTQNKDKTRRTPGGGNMGG